jgi:hypothetical protein
MHFLLLPAFTLYPFFVLSVSLPSLSCSTNTILSPTLPRPFNIYPHLSALCCTHPRLLGVREGTKPGFWRNLVGQGERWLILQVHHCHDLCPALCLLQCPVLCPVLCFFFYPTLCPIFRCASQYYPVMSCHVLCCTVPSSDDLSWEPSLGLRRRRY